MQPRRSVSAFPGEINWREESLPLSGQCLPRAVQTERGLGRRPAASCFGVCLVSVSVLLLLPPPPPSFEMSEPSFFGLPLWTEDSSLGIVQAFSTRLGLLRHTASWTEQLQGSQPPQHEKVTAGRSRQDHVSQSNIYPFYQFLLGSLMKTSTGSGIHKFWHP